MMNKFDELVEAIKQRGIQETAYENMKLTKENKDLQQKIENAIDFIKYNSGMISKWTNIKSRYAQEELSTDQLDDLLEILGGKE